MYFGFVKQLEIIGEASYKLTKEFRENHPKTPWNKIEGMRHVSTWLLFNQCQSIF